MPLSLIFISIIAGWFVNIVADTLPEQRSIRETWFWSFCGLTSALPLNFNKRCGDVPHARPLRYIGVWITALLLGWITYQRVGFNMQGLVLSLQAWFFLAVAIIDLEHRRVLNKMLIAVLPVLLLSPLVLQTPSLASAILGALVGFSLFLLLAILWRGAMGMGDVKLAGIIGLTTGYSGVFVALFVCIVAGGVAAIVVLIRYKFQRGHTIAYAPYLVFGAWTAMYYGPELLNFYLERL